MAAVTFTGARDIVELELERDTVDITATNSPLEQLAAHAVAHQPGKRALDIAIAVPLLMAALPVLLLVAIAIKLTDGGPVLFRQRRVGLGGHSFDIYKFRSMTVDAEDRRSDVAGFDVTDGLLFRVADDPRVTWIGKIIRRTGIDELPQLVNILAGDMSVVGPRPLAVALDDFDPIERLRHCVMPGLTGLWQVSGGNALAYDEMIELDLTYAQRWSIVGDLRIVARTVPAMIGRIGPS
ncbi:MAG TPA: sugar transferase [Acidimicrobiales bacterium]